MTLAALPDSNTFERDVSAHVQSAARSTGSIIDRRIVAHDTAIGVRELAAQEVREVAAGLSHRAKVLDLPVTIDDVLRELDRLAERIEP